MDDRREHIACPQCRALLSKQEPLRKALGMSLNETALESLTSAARARLDEMLSKEVRPLAYYDAWLRSPVGPLFVAVSDAGLCAVSFRSSEDDFVRRLERRGFRAVRSPERTGGAIAELREYFAGRRRRFDVLVDLTGQSRFQRLVLEATAAVLAGEVVSYGEVARRIGMPRACRAVGAALGQNPVPIVVPCHRVIGSDGGLHGYGGGLDVKEKLLRLEGVSLRSQAG